MQFTAMTMYRMKWSIEIPRQTQIQIQIQTGFPEELTFIVSSCCECYKVWASDCSADNASQLSDTPVADCFKTLFLGLELYSLPHTKSACTSVADLTWVVQYCLPLDLFWLPHSQRTFQTLLTNVWLDRADSYFQWNQNIGADIRPHWDKDIHFTCFVFDQNMTSARISSEL